MKKQAWVLLSLASVLLVFCAVHAVRGPAASGGAQRTAVGEDLVPPAENGTGAGANGSNAASDWHVGQLETARKAQRTRQQEAARELQRRQREGARSLS